jgi:hypothetical protein
VPNIMYIITGKKETYNPTKVSKKYISLEV